MRREERNSSIMEDKLVLFRCFLYILHVLLCLLLLHTRSLSFRVAPTVSFSEFNLSALNCKCFLWILAQDKWCPVCVSSSLRQEKQNEL